MVQRDKVTQQKEKDFEDVKPNVSFTDQQDDLQETVYDICRDAYSRYSQFCSNPIFQSCSMMVN